MASNLNISSDQRVHLNALKATIPVESVHCSEKGTLIIFSKSQVLNLNSILVKTGNLWEADAVAADKAFHDAVDTFVNFFKTYDFPIKS